MSINRLARVHQRTTKMDRVALTLCQGRPHVAVLTPFLLAFAFSKEQTALEAAARTEPVMARCAITRGSSDQQSRTSMARVT